MGTCARAVTVMVACMTAAAIAACGGTSPAATPSPATPIPTPSQGAQATPGPAHLAADVIGTPGNYDRTSNPRPIRDLRLLGDRVYIAHGDLFANPTGLHSVYYATQSGQLVDEGAGFEERALSSMRPLDDGRLAAPGPSPVKGSGRVYLRFTGGASWIATGALSGSSAVFDAAVHEASLWAVGVAPTPRKEAQGSAWHSEDNGRTWTRDRTFDAAIGPNPTENALVAQASLGVAAGGLFAFFDHGACARLLPSGGWEARQCFDEGSPSLIYATSSSGMVVLTPSYRLLNEHLYVWDGATGTRVHFDGWVRDAGATQLGLAVLVGPPSGGAELWIAERGVACRCADDFRLASTFDTLGGIPNAFEVAGNELLVGLDDGRLLRFRLP